ncbi:MAG: tRNA (adenosine(37)-N6)-threonylcarbamoyltransferase complex ATPase subunit type 1 TsaE [Oscillospiraceae bacterium]|nr:tRNA (adenosine(37)-N6)-threonylcarbamoyltransferase complex ATPase subunit type 1 TsaE [Oscillospiraceae bacterium]MBQ4312390.1 tRNA (adenosine(37)-N6)-threonylcarbamoyltransferase complex ATPase subunit type 1 TsaE [Oscillospiraceae bacterium]MBQ5417916.1 tRNA (adenosine(37)-N6)-threonylcarbamoyltransferase complex ATPase subunit type 1 TsaE [Oscillospiraceae bacterium]MCR5166482.1 tRNA (adenosine(37)-N6)-threonylcarbamoyltransferase complex ATPase subunit type 1 TsaE [Oscillospiraceae bact
MCVSSPEETIAFAEKIGSLLKSGDIIAYRGGLGAGKTTFTRGLALGMGLPDNVSSPTFALINEYRGRELSLFHFDMYRIMNEEALETTGFYDYMEEDGVIAVEWSENISELLPEKTIIIDIAVTGENERRITVTGDERFDSAWD